MQKWLQQWQNNQYTAAEDNMCNTTINSTFCVFSIQFTHWNWSRIFRSCIFHPASLVLHVPVQHLQSTRLKNIFNNISYVSAATIDSERHRVCLSSGWRLSKFVTIIGLMRVMYGHHRKNAAGALYTVTLFRYMYSVFQKKWRQNRNHNNYNKSYQN